MTRSQGLVGRLFLFAIAFPPAGLIAGCFGNGATDPDADLPALAGSGGATGSVDTVPGVACDTQLLTGATACGFAVVIPN